MIQGVSIQEVAFQALSRRISNHSRRSTQQQIGLVTTSLQMTEHHNATQVADMQGIGRWVSAQISRHDFFFK